MTYVIFDLLHLEGRDLMAEPYGRRRELLERLGLSGPSWQTPAYSTGQASAPGAWLKVKNVGRQELVMT